MERHPADDVTDDDVRQRHEALAFAVRSRLGVRRSLRPGSRLTLLLLLLLLMLLLMLILAWLLFLLFLLRVRLVVTAARCSGTLSSLRLVVACSFVASLAVVDGRIFAGACCRFFHCCRGSCHRYGSRRSYGNGAALSFGSCGRLVLRSRLQQLPYLDEDDDVDDNDDDAGNVMAKERRGNVMAEE